MNETADTRAEYSYLTLRTGARSGTNYLLDPQRTNRLGRGIDCDVVLADPLCSRVHAELQFVDGAWQVRDAGSRNGTFVNDIRVNEVGQSDAAEQIQLASGASVRTGSTEFTFYSSDQPPTVAIARDAQATEDIIREAAVDSEDSGRIALAALRRNDGAADLTFLYQLSLRLLSCDEPIEVLRITLEQIYERTNAAVVGFLWITDDGELKPQMLLPDENAGVVSLSQSLTKIVLEAAPRSLGRQPKVRGRSVGRSVTGKPETLRGCGLRTGDSCRTDSRCHSSLSRPW